VLEYSDPDNAKSSVMQYASEWVRKIETDAINVKDIEISGYGKARELQMTKGSIKITLPNSTSSTYLIDNNLEVSQSSNIHIETTDYDLMDNILTQSDQAYWVFTSNVSTPYDVPSLVAMIRDATAKEPPHLSDHKVSYMLPQVNTIDFRVDIEQKSLMLVCNQRPPNQGFYRAHKVFSPTKIIEILLTEINYNESQRMFSQAIVKPG
jgi:hypothetical protein